MRNSPTANAAKCYLIVEVSGDYAGLLSLVTGKKSVVEARGVEPLSEDRQHTASTCVADNLISQPSTPVGRLRTAASPEQSRPQPLGTSLGPARCIAPFHPRGPQMEERHSLLSCECQFLIGSCIFPELTSPRELDMPRWYQYPRRNRSPPSSEVVETTASCVLASLKASSVYGYDIA